MKVTEKNGKKFKSAYSVLQKTGQGVKFATNTGYKTGYFMAKHPNIEKVKNNIEKNYKTGLLALIGLGVGLIGMIKVISKLKK